MNALPYSTQIDKVELVNFTGTKSVDILPQMVECSLYESVFSNLHRAIIVMYDPISLFNNFPMIGEEFILVTLKDQDDNRSTYAYVIDTIENIQPTAKSREVSYIINLTSITALPNVLGNVMHAYNGRVSDILKDLFNDYVIAPLIDVARTSDGLKYAMGESVSNYWKFNLENIEESLGDDNGTICIPNMRPLAACDWLAAKAVPQNYEDNYKYLFWQANDGYHFETIQRVYTRDTKRSLTYYSDSEIISKLSNEDRRNAITNITINNRISALQKITKGYFQDTLFEINMAQQKYNAVDTLLDNFTNNIEGDMNKRMNTDRYIDVIPRNNSIQGNLETSNRVKYIFNNRMDHDSVTPLMNRDLNWGNSVRSSVALGHVDLHITIQGDHTLAAGDIIEIDIAKMEGFNENDSDNFIVGRYVITDVKNLFLTAAGNHTTVLRINKDTYNTDPDEVSFAYGEGYDLDVLGNSIESEKL